MVAAPLTVFPLKGIASVLNSAFGTLPYTINIGIANDWNLIVFGMLMIAKARKKIWEQVGKQLFWRKRAQKHSEQRCLQFLLWRFFCFLGIFFLVTYIRETDFCVWWSTFLLFACVMHFHQEIKTRRILKLLKVKWDHPGNNSIEICFTAIEWEYCILLSDLMVDNMGQEILGGQWFIKSFD